MRSPVYHAVNGYLVQMTGGSKIVGLDSSQGIPSCIIAMNFKLFNHTSPTLDYWYKRPEQRMKKTEGSR